MVLKAHVGYTVASKAYTAYQKYDLELNSISVVLEKKSLQAKLTEENGQIFGNKLYEYIYEPFLESKHKLLDAVILGNISKEKAEESLKTKLVPMPVGDTTYAYKTTEEIVRAS